MTIDEIAQSTIDALTSYHSLYDPRAANDYVYHYTSFKGLEGILQNKFLWMNETTYMNDRMELKEFGKQSISNLAQVVYGTDRSPHPRNRGRLWWIDYFSRVVNSRLDDTAYLSSFSAESSLLSQWRAYCPIGGVSIGFPVSALRAAAAAQSYSCSWCEYDTPDWTYFFVANYGTPQQRNFPKIWQDMYEHVLNLPISDDDITEETQPKDVLQSLARYGTDVDPKREAELARRRIILNNLVETCFQTAPVFKNFAFREEREFRVFSLHPDPAKLMYRPGPGGYVTYVPFSLENYINSEGVDILIGPCEPDRRKSLLRAVDVLLTKLGIKRRSLEHCDIPLRFPSP